MNRFLCSVFFGASLACCAQAYAAPAEVDRVVAIVNSEAVPWSLLRDRVNIVRQNLQRQKEPMPPDEVLERQILEQIIMERLQLQQARELSIRVDEGMVDRYIKVIADNNQITVDKLRASVAKDGIPWASFREEIRSKLITNRLRETEVDNKVTVSDSEVTNFLNANPEAVEPMDYLMAHIVLSLPENAGEAQMRAALSRAERVLARLGAGESFARVAAESSDAPDKNRGGELGWRSREKLPAFYAEVAPKIQRGEVTPPLRGADGLHIIKLLDKRKSTDVSGRAVEQTHARHILLKTSEILSDAEAQARLTGIRERIVNGADFAELAKASSADLSGAHGGDLGWLNPGDTVPEFEKAMNALAPNQISEPIHSPFGWHLIQVLERKKQDISGEYLRNAARNLLRQRKADEAYEEWLRQLRDSAYVENRLETPE
ncbi:MAG: peptidylprolyl isomerase [Azoarcus sp.]|nr:peptidylprolyl isomerase [Azoarcus sp.]